jgi:hypothetical protein
MILSFSVQIILMLFFTNHALNCKCQLGHLKVKLSHNSVAQVNTVVDASWLLDWNLEPETCYSDWCFSWFSSVPSENVWILALWIQTQDIEACRIAVAFNNKVSACTVCHLGYGDVLCPYYSIHVWGLSVCGLCCSGFWPLMFSSVCTVILLLY